MVLGLSQQLELGFKASRIDSTQVTAPYYDGPLVLKGPNFEQTCRLVIASQFAIVIVAGRLQRLFIQAELKRLQKDSATMEIESVGLSLGFKGNERNSSSGRS